VAVNVISFLGDDESGMAVIRELGQALDLTQDVAKMAGDSVFVTGPGTTIIVAPDCATRMFEWGLLRLDYCVPVPVPESPQQAAFEETVGWGWAYTDALRDANPRFAQYFFGFTVSTPYAPDRLRVVVVVSTAYSSAYVFARSAIDV
jgi:hypothetical protein